MRCVVNDRELKEGDHIWLKKVGHEKGGAISIGFQAKGYVIETPTSSHLLHMVHYWASDPQNSQWPQADFFHTSLITCMDGNIAVTRNSRYEIHFLVSGHEPDVPNYGQVIAMMLGGDPTKVEEVHPGIFSLGTVSQGKADMDDNPHLKELWDRYDRLCDKIRPELGLPPLTMRGPSE